MKVRGPSFTGIVLAVVALQQAAIAQTIDLVPVVAKSVSRVIDLPGEFQPFLSVGVHARVTGYEENVLVDRGSVVKQGQLLVELSAPEIKSQIAEAESKFQTAEAERVQAEAQLAAAQSTFERLKEASKTPGAIAGNELIQAEKQVDAAKALLNARQHASQAAQASVDAIKTMESYLKVTAPFDGVITTRLVHPGALVGPNSDSALLEIQQVSKLRLVVSVPEENVSGALFVAPALHSASPLILGGRFPERLRAFLQLSIPKPDRCRWSWTSSTGRGSLHLECIRLCAGSCAAQNKQRSYRRQVWSPRPNVRLLSAKRTVAQNG
jgi:multidrug efflux pump subunit AcrA (membrane-fusion protein)